MGTHPIFESDFDCLTDSSMSFGDVSTAPGLVKLDSYLVSNSYAGGWVPSQVDVALFAAIKSSPDAKFVNALLWYNNIASYKAEFASLPKDAEAERIKAERIAAYNARKSAKEEKKGKIVAKSSIMIDIKPWDDETCMKELEDNIRTIEMDGLLWGTGKLIAIGYGIKKLQITCVIEDDKVMMDDLEDKVTGFEDFVQSMDIAAFNKI